MCSLKCYQINCLCVNMKEEEYENFIKFLNEKPYNINVYIVSYII